MASEAKGSPKAWQPETVKSQAEAEPRTNARNNLLMPRKDVIKVVLSKG
jgi:hypothetical protein